MNLRELKHPKKDRQRQKAARRKKAAQKMIAKATKNRTT